MAIDYHIANAIETIQEHPLNAEYLNGQKLDVFASKTYVTNAVRDKQDASTILSDITRALGSSTDSGYMYLDYDADASNHLVSLVDLPIATASKLGVIKAGYATSGKNYKLQVDSSGNGYVNVPWTNTTYSAVSNTNNTSTVPAYGLMGMFSYYTNINQGWSNIVNSTRGIFIRFGVMTNTSKGTAVTVSFNQPMKMCIGTSTTQVSANAVSVMLVDGSNMSQSAGYRSDLAVTNTTATGFTYIASNTEGGTIRYMAIGVYGI